MKTKITIATFTGFIAVTADTFTEAGFQFGVHKGLKGGWVVTELTTGQVFAKGVTKSSARQACSTLLRKHDAGEITARLAKSQPAPSPDGLDVIGDKPATPRRTIDLDALVGQIASVVDLGPVEKLAVKAALSSKTGRLKASAPSDDWGKAAWNGLQPNAFKVQFSACFLRGGPAELLKKLARINWPDELDKDKAALKGFGVW